MPEQMNQEQQRIAVVGLGYIGRPLALALASVGDGTVGYDIDPGTVSRVKRSLATGEGSVALEAALHATTDPDDLEGCTLFVVAVPTPVDEDNRPDLGPLEAATRKIGQYLRAGGIVVFESTVYPGATEEVCVPILEEMSGLRYGRDFSVAYAPERINTGDSEHTIDRMVKVVAAPDDKTFNAVAAMYRSVTSGGVHRAASIRVAETAKVLENAQRDLNIALMNELAQICHKLDIETHEVLATAGTKWNFLPFRPGLVGGHCVGVDPYYLTSRAEQSGIHPEVMLAARRRNESMGRWVAQEIAKLLAKENRVLAGVRVGVFGATYKEDVCDLRNSRVYDLVEELEAFGLEVLVCDPVAEPGQLRNLYGERCRETEEMEELSAALFAVGHTVWRGRQAIDQARSSLAAGANLVVDIDGVTAGQELPPPYRLWRL